ncbi:hypothetical protein ACIBF5_14595 [Micromonospora sp. NPDC050417]|uniref:hypothetical protein n=1 Tax=Micromonospora sp. NPDC050417 TaxID=3364280 RepID=UPI0037926C04
MIMLEDSLRSMFSERVESPPLINDPASVAIRRGRAARRRRAAASSVAVALALVVTVGGIVSLRDISTPGGGGREGSWIAFNGQPEPTPTNPAVEPQPTIDTGIGLDLWAGNRLWTMDGRTLPLTGVGTVSRIYRVPTGWVYGGAAGVRFLRPDGSSISLSGNDDRWVLSSGGDQLAFVIDTVLYVARVSSSGLAVRTMTPVPAGITPVAFLDQQVVIAEKSRGFDLVTQNSVHQANWNNKITEVYGSPNGKTLVGRVPGADVEQPCLAELRASDTGLVVARTGTCALDLTRDTAGGRITPDGGWVAERRADDIRLVDLTQALAGQDRMVLCPIRTTVRPAWADERTLLAADDRGVVRCGVDGTEKVVPLPSGVTAQWQFVPRLTSNQPAG